MNFQEIADSFDSPTCVISVEKTENGGYGVIRLVAGNAKYLEPIEHPVFLPQTNMPGVPEIFQSTNKFIPNSPYEKYLPKDLGFEDVCFRAAVKKLPVHTYVHLNDLDIWFDIFCLPIAYEDGNICYCAYTAQPSGHDSVGVSSSQSGSASEDVIKTCIKLHSTNDLKKTMDDVIKDIRLICRAEVCTIILADTEKKEYSVLSTSIVENSSVKRITNFSNFGDISASWLGMFGGNDCLIIKDKKDMEYIRNVNLPWYLTLMEAGVNSLVLFPLKYNKEVLGFVWATNFDTANTMRIKETLELTTFFISSKLSSYRMLEHLREISYTDQLTGIPNRHACTELIGELIKNNESFAVVSIDINGFKSINDTMGFESGNKVLIEIASRWKKIADDGITGTVDYIARMGGDEFALIIRGSVSDEELLKTIRKYESALGQSMTVDGCDFFISASFGYSVFPEDAQTIDSLITYANASMTEVKRVNSSNHIRRFSSDLIKEERTLEIERKLINALENDTVYYNLQPQFDISHRLRGFEALARLKDEDGNNISPGEFIPVAEKVGLVDKVDGTVFRKAAMFIGDLIRRTGADIILSVNVSVRHLMKNDFLDEVREILEQSGLPAERLEIEITESIMIDSAEKALRCIEEIRSMGIKIAIDDFGTGYSSLSYLNSFPANLLKIDKSFIDKMNQSDSSKQYIAAIISIGHIMGIDVISEGVEEDHQLETLRDIGCDYIQGFVWGRPLPREKAEKLVIEQLNNIT
ncbi:diguanylate cyclase (GGDEF) domain-containing protein [Ruminococcaceae bacterium FB2012]|nr:diguanylate cyclase (GGDEF) domain-containing protein [Ruminococcaceae bacterium FB2012]